MRVETKCFVLGYNGHGHAKAVLDRLQLWKAKKLLNTVWILRSDWVAEQVREELAKTGGKDAGIVVKNCNGTAITRPSESTRLG